MAQVGSKRKTKTNNTQTTPSAAPHSLESMSAATVSQDQDAGPSIPPSSDFSEGEGSGIPAMRRTRAIKKKNYTDQEMEVLVDEVIENFKILFPGRNENCPMVIRDAAWTNILQKVNATGICKRTVPEIKKKWSDLKKKVKAKLAAIARYARQTGGGPSCPEKLTHFEEKVATTCQREQIEGFGEADICLQAISTSIHQSQEIPTPNVVENFVEESLEIAPSDSETPTENVEAGPQNLPTHTQELLLPSDLGLSEPQTTYINEYTNQHLQFMSRVDGRFNDLQIGLSKLADAYLSGSNLILQGLTNIAQILKDSKSNPNENVESRSSNNLISDQNTAPETNEPNIFRVSTSSEVRDNSNTSITTVPSNGTESQGSACSIQEDDDSSSGNPIDLSLPLPQESTMPQPTNVAIDNAGTSSSQANFLIACKRELAKEGMEGNSDSEAPTTGTMTKKLGARYLLPKTFQPPPCKKGK